jgi:type I restriction enzyme S subunit
MQTVITQYKDLTRWDIKNYLWLFRSSFSVEPLGNYIYEHSEKEKIGDQADKEFPILGVTNKIGVYLNEYVKSEKINQPYKKVKGGELTYNPYRVNVGSVGIVQDEYDNFYISPAYVVFGTKEGLLNEYIYLVLSSSWFNPYLRAATSGSVRQNLTFDLLSELNVPIPPLAIQKKIVEQWHKAKKQAEELSKKAQEQEKEIDDFILRELGVEKKEYEKKKGAFVARFMDLERWDVQFFTGDINLTVKNFVPLRDAIDKFENGKIVPSKGEVYNYIGLENVEKNNGKYDFVECDGSEIKSQSIVLKKGCVYYAKLRPYLNKCFLFKKNEDNFIATSELYGFSVKENIDKNFLLEILLSELIQNQIKDLMIGARMPRISEDSFKNLKIIIPPFPKQKQIAEKVEKMRAEIQEMKNISDETLEQAKNKIGAMLKV